MSSLTERLDLANFYVSWSQRMVEKAERDLRKYIPEAITIYLTALKEPSTKKFNPDTSIELTSFEIIEGRIWKQYSVYLDLDLSLKVQGSGSIDNIINEYDPSKNQNLQDLNYPITVNQIIFERLKSIYEQFYNS